MLKKPSPITLLRAACAGLLLTTSMGAMAQWQWVDGTGRKVFSDTAPPASIPDKNIIKSPGPASRTPAAAPMPAATAADGATTPASPAAPVPAVASADKELEARKKQADQAEEARKKAEEQRLAKARAENCDRAKKGKGTMDSGVRVATTNAKGEREVMDDKARADESRRLSDIIRSDCGALPATVSAQ